MKKMKQVCQETGLTEKAIRLYIKQELIHPQIEEGIHRNSYQFTENDVADLRDIATLRRAGFSMADIRQMQEYPEQLPAILEEKQTMLATDICQMLALQSALTRLSIPEQGDTVRLAEALRPAVRKVEVPRKMSENRFWRIGVLGVAVALIIWVSYLQDSAFVMCGAGGMILFTLGIVSIVMAYRYATCEKRAKKFLNYGKGCIASVVMENGFDAAFARAGSAGAGMKEPGIGGLWQIFWMFWNEIRPDCWYPLIQYKTQDGRQLAGTFPYGGLRYTWQEETEIEIAWDENRPGYLLPLDGTWLKKKAIAYTFLTLVLLGAACLLFGHVWRVS